MKTPRLSDFDPDAKVPTLKSTLDDMPVIQKPKPRDVAPSPSLSTAVQTEDNRLGTTVPVPGYHGTAVPDDKRIIKRRHPFDVYQDQLKTLRTLSREEQEQGLPGSQSAMVREALDDY